MAFRKKVRRSTKFTTETQSSQRGVVFFVILHVLCAPFLNLGAQSSRRRHKGHEERRCVLRDS